MARSDEVARELQDGQRGQAQEVELHQAHILDIVFIKLADSRLATRLLIQRAKIGELAGRNQHTTRMHADVACHAF